MEWSPALHCGDLSTGSMLDFHEKRRLQRILHHKYFLLALLVPIGFLWYAAYNTYTAEREMYARRVELEERLAELKQQSMVLESNIARLNDKQGFEAELRRRYDVAKEGEEVIVLLEEDTTEEESMPVQEEQETSWWDAVRSWF